MKDKTAAVCLYGLCVSACVCVCVCVWERESEPERIYLRDPLSLSSSKSHKDMKLWWARRITQQHTEKRTHVVTHSHTPHTHCTRSSAVGQPITGAACGGRKTGRREEEVEREMKSVVEEEWGVRGLRALDAHQLLMLNSESDHCLSAGPEREPAWLFPPLLLTPPPTPLRLFLSPFLMGTLFLPDSPCSVSGLLCTAERRRFDGRPLSAARCCSPSLPLSVSHPSLCMPHAHHSPHNALPF